MEQQQPSLFISSCSRRQLARRRPRRTVLGLRAVARAQLAAVAMLALSAFAVFVALHGGV